MLYSVWYRVYGIWVVVKIVVPDWVLSILRHLVLRGNKKETMVLTTTRIGTMTWIVSAGSCATRHGAEVTSVGGAAPSWRVTESWKQFSGYVYVSPKDRAEFALFGEGPYVSPTKKVAECRGIESQVHAYDNCWDSIPSCMCTWSPYTIGDESSIVCVHNATQMFRQLPNF